MTQIIFRYVLLLLTAQQTNPYCLIKTFSDVIAYTRKCRVPHSENTRPACPCIDFFVLSNQSKSTFVLIRFELLIFELGTREHVTASLLRLHWLPVRWRVQFKLCCLMHSIFYEKCPGYLDNIAVVLVAVSDQQTFHCHGYVPSSASAPSPTPAHLHGTLYLRTYVLSLILDW